MILALVLTGFGLVAPREAAIVLWVIAVVLVLWSAVTWPPVLKRLPWSRHDREPTAPASGPRDELSLAAPRAAKDAHEPPQPDPRAPAGRRAALTIHGGNGDRFNLIEIPKAVGDDPWLVTAIEVENVSDGTAYGCRINVEAVEPGGLSFQTLPYSLRWWPGGEPEIDIPRYGRHRAELIRTRKISYVLPSGNSAPGRERKGALASENPNPEVVATVVVWWDEGEAVRQRLRLSGFHDAKSDFLSVAEEPMQ